MFEIWSFFSELWSFFRGHHCLESFPRPIEYREASIMESGVYHRTYCTSASTKRSPPMWSVSVVGAPEQKALEILVTVYNILREKPVNLRWWREGLPCYNSETNNSETNTNGCWVYCSPEPGCIDVPRTNFGAQVTLVYYSNGSDPRALFENIPDGEFLMYHLSRMLIPVCDYVFDKESCETVMCSENSPLYQVQTGSSNYYAPVPFMVLDSVREGIYQRGGKLRTLGEMNSSL